MPITLTAAGAAAGHAIIKGSLYLPRVGAWVADLHVAADVPMTGKVELALGETLVLNGTVSRGGMREARLHVRVVAGGDGLRSLVKPKHYTSPTVRVVMRDLLGDVGETLSGTSSPAVLATQLEHWTTAEMPAALAVRCLLDHAGADVVWRHLPDGSVWVGKEEWPESAVRDFDVLEFDPEDDVVKLTLLTPEVLPGTTIGGYKVDTAEVQMSGARVVATVWAAP